MRNIVISVLLFISGYLNGQQINDWANLSRYDSLNKELIQSKKNVKIVLMGNSITEAWAAIHPIFFSQNELIGRGISGQTTPQMLVRFRADVVDLHPEKVVILAGTNDIAGNTGTMTLEQTLDNLKSMVELCQANAIKVALCSVLPATDFPWRPGLSPDEKIPQLNELIKAYCIENKLVYIDFFSAMTDGNNGLREELTYDGVHPNESGYWVMEKILMKVLLNTD